MVLTASSAWLAVGVLGLALAVHVDRAEKARKGVALAIGVCGAALLGIVALGALTTVSVGPVAFNGIRPAIWVSAAEAVRAAPLWGVGATPIVASALDPLMPDAGYFGWDAHQMPLSVVAQFGAVGIAHGPVSHPVDAVRGRFDQFGQPAVPGAVVDTLLRIGIMRLPVRPGFGRRCGRGRREPEQQQQRGGYDWFLHGFSGFLVSP